MTVTKGKSEKIVESQEIEVGIRPGQIGALVANVTYTATPGDMKVDSRTLAFVSYQPENVQGYSVVYTDCGSKFQALTLPKAECRTNSATRLTRCSTILHYFLILIPLFGLLLIL